MRLLAYIVCVAGCPEVGHFLSCLPSLHLNYKTSLQRHFQSAYPSISPVDSFAKMVFTKDMNLLPVAV